jgi:hypothetical protein
MSITEDNKHNNFDVNLSDFQNDSQRMIDSLDEYTQKQNSFFLIRTANRCMEEAKLKPIPRMLFGEFWFEGEVCILYADTNLGKSILAVQIANSISCGQPIQGFKLEAPPQKVLYFDFELSEKQFEARYSINYEHHYRFDDNFLRAEINPDNDLPDMFKDFESYLNFELKRAIEDSGAKVLIIDNLTYLRNETEKAKDAMPLMKELKKLKSQYGLSILAIAHTPKRDSSKPIGRNDLQGSKMLINFCDSSFAVGESFKDKSIRYLKQIKARNTGHIYDSDNVCVCQIDKPSNFLNFEFLDFGNEQDHLRLMTNEDKSQRIERVKELSTQGKNQRTIATELGISLGAVNKYLKK